MPRRSYEDVVKTGLLTPGVLALMCNSTPQTVRNWCESGQIEHRRAGQRDLLIPAPAARRYLTERLIGFHPNLNVACEYYVHYYGDSVDNETVEAAVNSQPEVSFEEPKHDATERLSNGKRSHEEGDGTTDERSTGSSGDSSDSAGTEGIV